MDTMHQHPFDPALKPIEGRDIAASGGPHPIAVIGGRHGDEICFATVAWSMPVSHKPPMVAFALRAKSCTFQLVEQSGRFSISTPDAALEGAVNTCGNKTGNAVDKSALVEWALLPEMDSEGSAITAGDDAPDANPSNLADGGADASRNDLAARTSGANASGSEDDGANPAALPALTGALTVLECRVESIQPAGDHALVVGTVERAWSRASVDDRGRIDPTDALLCVQHDLFATVR